MGELAEFCGRNDEEHCELGYGDHSCPLLLNSPMPPYSCSRVRRSLRWMHCGFLTTNTYFLCWKTRASCQSELPQSSERPNQSMSMLWKEESALTMRDG